MVRPTLPAAILLSARGAAAPLLAAALLLAGGGCSSTTTEQFTYGFPENGQASSVLDSRLRHLEKMAEEYPKRSDIPFQMAGVYYQKEAYRDSAKALER